MKAYPSLLSLVVLLGHLVGTITVQAEEGEFVSRAQAVEENISDCQAKVLLSKEDKPLVRQRRLMEISPLVLPLRVSPRAPSL